MPSPISFAVVLLAGFGLGIVFFGGLWMTVRRLPRSPHPGLLTVASFWGRTAIVVSGFILVMGGRWENAVVCLAGFMLARFVLTRKVPYGYHT